MGRRIDEINAKLNNIFAMQNRWIEEYGNPNESLENIIEDLMDELDELTCNKETAS